MVVVCKKKRIKKQFTIQYRATEYIRFRFLSKMYSFAFLQD